jgi:hypothetical protein
VARGSRPTNYCRFTHYHQHCHCLSMAVSEERGELAMNGGVGGGRPG